MCHVHRTPVIVAKIPGKLKDFSRNLTSREGAQVIFPNMEDDDRRTATGHLCQMVSNPPIPTTWSEGHPTLAHISDLDVRQTQASTIWNPSCVLSQASYVRMTQQNHVNWTTCSRCLFTVRHHLKHTHRNNQWCSGKYLFGSTHGRAPSGVQGQDKGGEAPLKLKRLYVLDMQWKQQTCLTTLCILETE